MSALFVMIPAALVLAGAAVVAFHWAVRSGQFDDPDGDACRLLFEDDDEPPVR